MLAQAQQTCSGQVWSTLMGRSKSCSSGRLLQAGQQSSSMMPACLPPRGWGASRGPRQDGSLR